MSKLVGEYVQCDRYRTGSTGRTGLKANNFFPASTIIISDVHTIMPSKRDVKSFAPATIRNYIGHRITVSRENARNFLARETAMTLVFFKICMFFTVRNDVNMKHEHLIFFRKRHPSIVRSRVHIVSSLPSNVNRCNERIPL